MEDLKDLENDLKETKKEQQAGRSLNILNRSPYQFGSRWIILQKGLPRANGSVENLSILFFFYKASKVFTKPDVYLRSESVSRQKVHQEDLHIFRNLSLPGAFED